MLITYLGLFLGGLPDLSDLKLENKLKFCFHPNKESSAEKDKFNMTLQGKNNQSNKTK